MLLQYYTIDLILEIDTHLELNGKGAQIGTAHITTGIFPGLLFGDKLRTADGSLSPFLVQEVDNRYSQIEVFVGFPVDPAESFPTPVEVQGLLQVGISFTKITETEPQSQIFRDVVARIELHENSVFDR